MSPLGDLLFSFCAGDSLIETYRQADVTIVEEPENWSWGYEMKIADPDGNVLWLGTATRTDLPVVD